MIRSRLGFLGRLAAVGLTVTALLTSAPEPARATTYVPISGAGSTWSQNALDQWIRNVDQYGLRINYAGTGSSDGRNQFRNGSVDFAVSEIPYGTVDNGVADPAPSRHYAYIPIVAGGTSFMYNLRIGGKLVTNLRLSGPAVAGIFTGNIKYWNDKTIQDDNPNLALPARRIVPVVRSDGSGTTAQFSLWLSKKFASEWDGYCSQAGRTSPCGQTSNFPLVSGNGFVAQSGSLGVSGYVAQSSSEGSITYVEYSYALNAGFPIAKVLNAAGYYVEPTAESAAVGLLGAKINEDQTSPNYLTQILDGVYDNPDPRTYPLSSYSYMILPTAVEDNFSTDKGNTLGAFAYYFLCEGQQQAPVLGYSPLPVNLVQAGLDQVKKIPGVKPESIDISKCNNPTFSSDGTNTLAKTAPYPSPCDKQDATQCTAGTGGAKKTATVATRPGGRPAPGQHLSTSGAPPITTPGAVLPGSVGNSPGVGVPAPTVAGSPTAAGSVVNPDTGQVQAGASTGADLATGSQDVGAQPVTVALSQTSTPQGLLMFLTGLLVLGLVVGPPLLSRRLGARGAK